MRLQPALCITYSADKSVWIGPCAANKTKLCVYGAIPAAFKSSGDTMQLERSAKALTSFIVDCVDDPADFSALLYLACGGRAWKAWTFGDSFSALQAMAGCLL